MNKKTTLRWRALTKKASSTFYAATFLFPPKIRDDVFTLYAYLRTADDYADASPHAEVKKLETYFTETKTGLHTGRSANPLIADFCDLSRRYTFDERWLDSFIQSLTWDIKGKTYDTFTQLELYIFGVADVVGLYLSRILDLPKRSYKAAQLTGKGMQLINIIRDIHEDYLNRRIYIPQEDMDRFGIKDVIDWRTDTDRYSRLIIFQVDRALSILTQAEKELTQVPKANRGALQAAISLYKQLAFTIKKNPLSVYKRRVRLSRFRIIQTVCITYFTNLWSR